MDISKFHSDHYTATFIVSYEVTQLFITPAPLHVMDMPKFFNVQFIVWYLPVALHHRKKSMLLTAKNSGPGKHNTGLL